MALFAWTDDEEGVLVVSRMRTFFDQGDRPIGMA
jgi:hypothetical protein